MFEMHQGLLYDSIGLALTDLCLKEGVLTAAGCSVLSMVCAHSVQILESLRNHPRILAAPHCAQVASKFESGPFPGTQVLSAF